MEALENLTRLNVPEGASGVTGSSQDLERSRKGLVLIINARFLGLCQVHKAMRWGFGVGGFGCRKGCWEEAHAQVHDRALRIKIVI